MKPSFLVPEITIHQNGHSDALQIAPESPLLVITLGMQHVIEQESLEIFIEASVDGLTWLTPALVEFPQKFYPGISAVIVDPQKLPDARFLRARWTTNRWGRGNKQPEFRFYLFIEALAPVVKVG